MQWLFGGLILVLGLTLVIAGATGNAGALFEVVTGHTAGSSTTASQPAGGAVADAINHPYTGIK